MSIYMGLRQTSNLDEPKQFLIDLEKTWALMLPGFVRPDRIDYFRQFIKRRTEHRDRQYVCAGGFQLTRTQVRSPAGDRWADPTGAC